MKRLLIVSAVQRELLPNAKWSYASVHSLQALTLLQALYSFLSWPRACRGPRTLTLVSPYILTYLRVYGYWHDIEICHSEFCFLVSVFLPDKSINNLLVVHQAMILFVLSYTATASCSFDHQLCCTAYVASVRCALAKTNIYE